MLAIVCTASYAVFALRFMGSKAHGKDVRDSVVKATLARNSAGGVGREGRGLKAEEQQHGHLRADADSYPDGVVYDEAIEHSVGSTGLEVEDEEEDTPEKEYYRLHPELRRPSPQRKVVDSPRKVTAPKVDVGNARHGQQRQQAGREEANTKPRSSEQAPGLATSSRRETDATNAVKADSSPGLAVGSRIESDTTAGKNGDRAPGLAVGSRIESEAGAKRADAHSGAPSLAVGSRLEADSAIHTSTGTTQPGRNNSAVQHAEPPRTKTDVQVDAKSVEPDSSGGKPQGAAPVRAGAIEAESNTGAGHVQAPVVTQGKVEADSGANQQQGQAPVLSGPTETDVTAHQGTDRAPAVTGAPKETDSNVHSTGTAPTDSTSQEHEKLVQQAATQQTQAQQQQQQAQQQQQPAAQLQQQPAASGLYALEAVDIDGKTRSLSEFAGKVTLVVNVASACGYTDENYKGLMQTYEKYHKHGLEILGFPCNQFGRQESGTEAQIKNFCSTSYHVTFPMFSKVDVNGPNTHPVYQFLRRELPESEGGGGGKSAGRELIWNFQKILVNHLGQPVKLFYQNWDQGAVEQEIYRLLHEARTAALAAQGRQ